MLKIIDSKDQIIAVLEDESSEPRFLTEEERIEDAKKKKKKKKTWKPVY